MDNSNNLVTNEISIMKAVTIKSGIFTALGLIVYFLLMKMLNLHQNLNLHYFNIVVLFLGLRYAIKHIRSINGEIKYLEGLKMGLLVTAISLLIFNIFMLIYETVIDPAFLDFLQQNISLGGNKSKQGTILGVMGLITIEGLSSGFILTFILMQYYKIDNSETK